MIHNAGTIGFRGKEPSCSVAFRSEHLQTDASDFTDFTFVIHRARSRDDLTPRKFFTGHLVDQTKRVHHARRRPADVVHMHGHLHAGHVITMLFQELFRRCGGGILR